MKQVLAFVLFLFPFGLFSQDLISVNGSCSYTGEENEREYYAFDPSSEADRIVHEICTAIGLAKNFEVRSANVGNALATIDQGYRYVLYNTLFLEKFKAEAHTRWAAYSVMAHEVGHHLNGHDFTETDPKKRKKMEIQADMFSGSVLRMLGAPLEEAKAGIELFALEGESNTHPPGSARREAVASGWKLRDESLKALGITSQPVSTPTNEPQKTQPVQPQVTDTDQDGIPDNIDKCPTEKGEAGLLGCPRAFNMAFVRGGVVYMGSPSPSENAYYPSKHVNDFHIGTHEVTQGQWKLIMGEYPRDLNNKSCDECPVVWVSYREVQDFISRLNRKTGRQYRLPTEAEWEYAAKGGDQNSGLRYAGSNSAGDVAWHSGNSSDIQPVGIKMPNVLGIYDMSGNASELCSDLYSYTAPNGSSFTQAGDYVVRGGSVGVSENSCTVTARDKNGGGTNYAGGFRLAHNP
ncbi:MAG: SUMF1/EgtB/PvdO family nonheme iron enzyme [Saprospiraceae bacterium]